MTSSAYITGRKKYSRPQAMLWSDNPGTLSDGLYHPTGLEVGADPIAGQLENQFIILSDDNRNPIEFSIERIEKRERMVNGRMRSHHIADKLSVSSGWDMLPSRSFALRPGFDSDGSSEYSANNTLKHTTDGGAGGADILDWYESHPGSFWVFFAYDKKNVFGEDDGSYGHLAQYNEVVEMFFSDFSYSIEKRGGSTYDFWNISFTLEEV